MSMLLKRLTSALLILVCLLTMALVALTIAFFITKYHPPQRPASPTGDGVGSTPIQSGTMADGTPNGTPSPTDTITLPETPDAGLAYQDSLIFMGDSLTARLIDRGVLTGGTATTQVWRAETDVFHLKPGMSDQTIVLPGPGEHAGKNVSVAKAVALTKPSVLIITLGTDWGVSYYIPERESDFKTCYIEFIQGIRRASPDTTVILQSVFPVSARCTTMSNTQINRANQLIREIAGATDCRYLDTQSVLRDESGNLKAEFC